MACPIFKPNPKGIKKAAQIILRGGLIAAPTETFYGLAADSSNEFALKRIFQVKKRDEGKPILLLIADRSWLKGLVQDISPLAERLMSKFWPGPLTLVFEASPQVSPLLTAGTGKIGIRLSPHPVTQALVQAVGRAITGTSANLSGQPVILAAREVFRSLGKSLDAVIDGGKTPGGPGSTILDVSEPSPQLIREGIISRDEWENVIRTPSLTLPP
jgi:L-threonylcarbamoyladenylate synthase